MNTDKEIIEKIKTGEKILFNLIKELNGATHITGNSREEHEPNYRTVFALKEICLALGCYHEIIQENIKYEKDYIKHKENLLRKKEEKYKNDKKLNLVMSQNKVNLLSELVEQLHHDKKHEYIKKISSIILERKKK